MLDLQSDLARALDPVALALAVGVTPDAWQSQVLRSASRKALLLCCRQSGKSTTTALATLHAAIYSAPAMVLLVSPSQRQSSELFRKVVEFHRRLPGAPEIANENTSRLELKNGSRIISLPGSEATTRGYSAATLVVIDEASQVDAGLLAAVRPALATTAGRFIALTTPAGKAGWFYDYWTNGGDSFERTRITASECPRITPEFLEDERRDLGELLYRQEYGCEFVDSETSVFSTALIEAALVDDFEVIA